MTTHPPTPPTLTHTPPPDDLARPCTSCHAPPGKPCRTRTGEVWDRTHIDRRTDQNTAPLPVLRPAWPTVERRARSEAAIRADEREQAAKRAATWLSGWLTTRVDGLSPQLLELAGELPDVIREQR